MNLNEGVASNVKSIIAIVIAAGLVVVLWFNIKPATPTTGVSLPAKVDSRVSDTPKETLQAAPDKKVAGIDVYTPAAKKELSLPEVEQNDPDEHVVSAVEVPASEQPKSIVTLVNATSGQTEVLVQDKPQPWFAVEDSGELRLSYGYKTGGSFVSRISVREDIFQIRSIHFGVTGSYDTDGTAFVGAGIAYRW